MDFWIFCSNSKKEESEVKVSVAQLCLILCDPVDCSPPGSSLSVEFSRHSLDSRVEMSEDSGV